MEAQGFGGIPSITEEFLEIRKNSEQLAKNERKTKILKNESSRKYSGKFKYIRKISRTSEKLWGSLTLS